jgi:hypothetical protein
LGFQTTFAVFYAPYFLPVFHALPFGQKGNGQRGADRGFGYNQSIRRYLACASPFVKIRRFAG